MVSKVTISTDLELSIGFENRRLIWDLDKGYWGEVVGMKPSSERVRENERSKMKIDSDTDNSFWGILL